MADKQPPKTKKYFRSTKSGAGMTKAGVARYRRENPGSKLKTAVTGKVKPGSKAAKRRKSFCARSAGQMKKFPKAAKNPNSTRQLGLRSGGKSYSCTNAETPWLHHGIPFHLGVCHRPAVVVPTKTG